MMQGAHVVGRGPFDGARRGAGEPVEADATEMIGEASVQDELEIVVGEVRHGRGPGQCHGADEQSDRHGGHEIPAGTVSGEQTFSDGRSQHHRRHRTDSGKSLERSGCDEAAVYGAGQRGESGHGH